MPSVKQHEYFKGDKRNVRADLDFFSYHSCMEHDVFSTSYPSPRLQSIRHPHFLHKGNFDRVRYFTIGLAFIDVIRGFTAIVIAFDLFPSHGFSWQLDYQNLHLTLQSSSDVFSALFLVAIASDMYFRTFYPLTHKCSWARCHISVSFIIWIISMTLTVSYAFALGWLI